MEQMVFKTMLQIIFLMMIWSYWLKMVIFVQRIELLRIEFLVSAG